MTCSRVRSASASVGIAEESPNGSSKCHASRGSAARASGVTRNSRCSVPSVCAATRACSVSSYRFSAKPMLNVLSGSAPCSRRIFCATAQMTVLSTPPERNAPSGTSLRNRRRTARSTRRRVSSSQSSGLSRPTSEVWENPSTRAFAA